ncbi:MAG: hypothetical protein V7K47_30750 [Nostoc sp.]
MMKTPKSKSRFHQTGMNETSDLRPINPNAAGIDIGSEFHARECSIHIEPPRVSDVLAVTLLTCML